MIALLVGAGFSKWAAGLPLAKELFDFKVEPFGVREARRLERVRHSKAVWDLEHPAEPAEAFIAFALEQDAKSRRAVLWYVVRRLSDPYVWKEWHAFRWRRHVLMIDENRKRARPGVRHVRDFLVNVIGPRLMGVVTTNYDLLMEYSMGTSGFNYGSPGEKLQGRGPYPLSQWHNPVTLTGRVPLAKVHGSISWDAHGRYTDGRRGLTGDALIIAPVPHKAPPRSLGEQWELAGKILRGSSRLLVFGFAFNAYDSAFLELLEMQGRGLKDIMLVDTAPNENAARRIWKDAIVNSLPPPPQSEGELRRWVKGDAFEVARGWNT
jgi:hypothetical protein